MKKFILSMGVIALMVSIASCSGKNTENNENVEDTLVIVEQVDSVAVDSVCNDNVPVDSVTE